MQVALCKKTSIARFCTLRKEFSEKRAEYWRQEHSRESSVDKNLLSEKEKAIFSAHQEAINKGHFTYQDPETNDKIWTTYSHFLKGRCCGEACRHCIYDYESVPNELKKNKIFNGSFWIDVPASEVPYNSFKSLLHLIKIKPKIN